MKIKKSLIGLGTLLAAVLSLFNTVPAMAASASMSLSRSGATYKGGTVSISIRENSGSEPVNTASATLSYPTSLLSYSSVANSGAFSIVAATSGGGGSVHVERGALPAVSGSQTVATVRFKVLADSGTATVNITSGQVLSANTNANIAGGLSGTSFALSAAPVAAPAAPKDTTPPAITALKASNISFNSVTVTWTTSEPATSEVDYGPTKAYGLTGGDSNLATDHKVVLNSALIVPATNYHYLVKSTDGSGNTATSPDGTFTTQGGTISITLVDQKKKPLAGAKVSLLDASGTTNKQGTATVNNIQPGKQTMLVKYKGKTYSQTVTVSALDTNGQAQAAKYTVKVQPSNIWVPLIVIVLVLAVLAWWLRRGGGSLPPSITNRFSGLKKTDKPTPAPVVGGKTTTPPTPAAVQAPPTVIKPTNIKVK